MPKFFKVILGVCALISGTAIAVNTAIVTAGGMIPDWWSVIYPYLVGVPAGAAFVAKFTQAYGKDGEPVGKDGMGERNEETIAHTTLDKDDF